jgi:archaemetzincin
MRITLIIISFLIFFTACEKQASLSLKHTNAKKIIALQPLGNYNQQQLLMLQQDLRSFFQTDVCILKTIPIPQRFSRANDETYVADSIIQFLLQYKNDSVVQVVGLTHNEIFTVKESKSLDTVIGRPVSYWHKIRGLGYVSGEACIVSDNSLVSANAELWNNRLRKAVLHEMGHNLGLAHCIDDSCLMSEKNGDIAVLNKSGGDFCKSCRQKVN